MFAFKEIKGILRRCLQSESNIKKLHTVHVNEHLVEHLLAHMLTHTQNVQGTNASLDVIRWLY